MSSKSIINIVTVIQARMGSTRLPNKVMLSLAGKPLLIRIVERVKASRFTGQVVVSTTTDKEDDIIYDLCINNGILCFRGHPTDLLDRHYKTGIYYNADAVVKIPSDCPLIDPAIIDRVLSYFITYQDTFDYVSNLHPATYPDGNDVEIMHMRVLKNAWQNAGKPFEREHTTPYIWENPEKFRIGNVAMPNGNDFSMTYRWTVDYEDDYIFAKSVYDELYNKHHNFSYEEILHLVNKKEQIRNINSYLNGVNWYRNHLNDLKTINISQTKVI